MAAVLCITIMGGRHHESTLSGRYGNRYVSGFLLFDHHRYELYVCFRLSDIGILTLLNRAFFRSNRL